jgi:hypothetical protein
MSFGEPQRSGSNHEQARQPQPVNKVFGADAGEMQLDVPGVSASPADDVAENRGDLRIEQFVTGYLEQHGLDGSQIRIREQDGNTDNLRPPQGPSDCQKAERLTVTPWDRRFARWQVGLTYPHHLIYLRQNIHREQDGRDEWGNSVGRSNRS